MSLRLSSGAWRGMACEAAQTSTKPTRNSSTRPAYRRVPLLQLQCLNQNWLHQLNRGPLMSVILPKSLRALLITVGISIAVAALLAIILLGVAQFLPDEFSGGYVQWRDFATSLTGVFSGDFSQFMLTFAGVTLAILIAVLAALFAMVVTALVLAAIIVGFPLIVVVAVTWRVVHRSARQRHAATL